MVRELNQTFISPLKPVFRQERLGPLGDVPKLNCATCHGGQPKPFGGAQLLKDYPELNLTALDGCGARPERGACRAGSTAAETLTEIGHENREPCKAVAPGFII